MSKLMLAANWISNTQVYGHLQIVYTANGHDFLEVEVQAPDWWGIPFGGSFTFPAVRDHFNPNNTQGVGNDDTYLNAIIDLREGQDVEGAWSLIQQLHGSVAQIR